MVAVVFLAIAFRAGPILVPEMVARWKNCRRSALFYQRLSSVYANQANTSRLSNPMRMAFDQRKAASYEKKSQKYRRALDIPWDCWSFGDSAEAQQ